MNHRILLLFILGLFNFSIKAQEPINPCVNGNEPFWYAANTIDDLHDTGEQACAAYDMSLIGRPTFVFQYAELLSNQINYACYHKSPTAQTPEAPPINFINSAIRCIDKANFCSSNPESAICVESDNAGKDDGNGCGVGNPCNPATGNKFQSETDISNNDMSFVRSYNSSNLVDLGLGKGWRSGYQKRLAVSGDSLSLISGAGRGEPWSKTGGIWSGDADSDFIVTEDASGFTVTKQNGASESYNSDGQLLVETDTSGNQKTYAYNANNQLVSVTNHYGHSLAFTYDANDHLVTVTDANGAVYAYEYDTNDNLVAVIYPDTTPSDDADNPRRVYHYENTDYPNHLTGITDANGDRYATYAYDDDGKAISTEHAPTTNTVGQERFQLDYQN